MNWQWIYFTFYTGNKPRSPKSDLLKKKKVAYDSLTNMEFTSAERGKDPSLTLPSLLLAAYLPSTLCWLCHSLRANMSHRGSKNTIHEKGIVFCPIKKLRKGSDKHLNQHIQEVGPCN